MKQKLVFVFTAIALSFTGYGQTEAKTDPSHSISQQHLITVMFDSKRYISEAKAPLIEERFKVTFPNIKRISINTDTQKVQLELTRITSQVTITRILNYFKSTSYETL